MRHPIIADRFDHDAGARSKIILGVSSATGRKTLKGRGWEGEGGERERTEIAPA